MQFTAPENVPEAPDVIHNNSFWPDLDLAQFRQVMRIDGTVTRARLRQVMLTAVAEINAELSAYRERQELRGYNHLADVPGEMLAGERQRVQHYRSAVWCWTRAMLNERYQDVDATASGVKRGEALAEASGDLWRDARWAISRVQDAPHCTVELI